MPIYIADESGVARIYPLFLNIALSNCVPCTPWYVKTLKQ